MVRIGTSRITRVPFSPEEADAIRSALLADEPSDVCPRCGTILETSAPIAGGGSMAPIWELVCPPCNRVMIAGQMLDSLLDGIRPRKATPTDRAHARALPDEYLQLAGSHARRALMLVERHWPDASNHNRRELAQVLVLLLAPLTEGSQEIERLRAESEQVVVQWIERRP